MQIKRAYLRYHMEIADTRMVCSEMDLRLNPFVCAEQEGVWLWKKA